MGHNEGERAGAVGYTGRRTKKKWGHRSDGRRRTNPCQFPTKKKGSSKESTEGKSDIKEKNPQATTQNVKEYE